MKGEAAWMWMVAAPLFSSPWSAFGGEADEPVPGAIEVGLQVELTWTVEIVLDGEIVRESSVRRAAIDVDSKLCGEVSIEEVGTSHPVEAVFTLSERGLERIRADEHLVETGMPREMLVELVPTVAEDRLSLLLARSHHPGAAETTPDGLLRWSDRSEEVTRRDGTLVAATIREWDPRVPGVELVTRVRYESRGVAPRGGTSRSTVPLDLEQVFFLTASQRRLIAVGAELPAFGITRVEARAEAAIAFESTELRGQPHLLLFWNAWTECGQAGLRWIDAVARDPDLRDLGLVCIAVDYVDPPLVQLRWRAGYPGDVPLHTADRDVRRLLGLSWATNAVLVDGNGVILLNEANGRSCAALANAVRSASERTR